MNFGLLERDGHLHALDQRLAATTGGDGSLVVLRGAAGVGKSTLLREARAMAERRGLRTLWACGGELELGFPFGTVRQLFEAALSGLTGTERERILDGAAGLAAPLVTGAPSGSSDSSFPLLHGLYWLTANLAAEAPLVLHIDDAHWSDRQSLQWIHYLARRLSGLPVLVLVASRPAEPGANAELVDHLIDQAGTHALAVEPLSEDATGRLVRATSPRLSGEGLVHACWQATGGNPLLVQELLRDFADWPDGTGRTEAAEIAQVGPAGISRAVLVRLARISPMAVDLARAAAVLGGRSRLHTAARLACCPTDEAAAAADAMVGAGIFATADPAAFTHPVVQTAIYRDMPDAQRGHAHGRAADVLRAIGAPTEEIAAHLTRSHPSARRETVDLLLASGREALDRGAPETVIAQLRRALDEPPETDQRPEVLQLLGIAQARSGDPEGVAHLEKAQAISHSPHQRAIIARDLAFHHMMSLRLPQAVTVLASAADELRGHDPEAALALDAQIIGTGRLLPAADLEHLRLPERVRRMRDRLPGADAVPSPTERVAVATLTAMDMQTGRLAAAEAAASALKALGDGALLATETGDSGAPIVMGVVLLFSDHFVRAREAFDAVIADGQRRASLVACMQGLCMRAQTGYRAGDLLDAQADAQASLDLLDPPHPFLLPLQVAALIDVMVERDRLTDAEAALGAYRMNGSLPGEYHDSFLLCSRGKLRLAQQRVDDALADFQLAGHIQLEYDMPNPAILDWRSNAAIASARSGRLTEARSLADEELALAEAFGAPRALGLALRGRALVEPDAAKTIELLERSADVLSQTQAALDHARALTDLGAALRRTNRRAAAREPLRQALDLSHRRHATRLVNLITDELRAAGARPRRPALSGAEALTHSERRVAQLAVEGLTNREIAQALFITTKTVEDHLSRSYAKLGVTGRHQLADAGL